jgi:hypothetical protein
MHAKKNVKEWAMCTALTAHRGNCAGMLNIMFKDVQSTTLVHSYHGCCLGTTLCILDPPACCPGGIPGWTLLLLLPAEHRWSLATVVCILSSNHFTLSLPTDP